MRNVEGGVEKENDFYGVLGLKKECTDAELRTAYKKLAMRWHPDRWLASGNAESVDEAKKKFQDVQEAYSVLSDSNKRFLYDVGVYDKEEDDENVQEMGDFLNEMAAMMKQNNSDIRENGGIEDSYENLQDLFQEIFQADIAEFNSSNTHSSNLQSGTSNSCSFTFESYSNTSNSNNKRNSTDLNFGPSGFDPLFQNFCFGVGGGSWQMDDRSKRRNSRQ